MVMQGTQPPQLTEFLCINPLRYPGEFDVPFVVHVASRWLTPIGNRTPARRVQPKAPVFIEHTLSLPGLETNMNHTTPIVIILLFAMMPLTSAWAQTTPEPMSPERLERVKKYRDQRETRRKAMIDRRSAKKALRESQQELDDEKSQRRLKRQQQIEDRKTLLERPQIRRETREALTGRNITSRRLPSKEVVTAKREYIRAQREVRSQQNQHNQRIAILKRILEVAKEQNDERAIKQARQLLDKEASYWRVMRAQNARKLSAAKAALTRSEKESVTRPAAATTPKEVSP